MVRYLSVNRYIPGKVYLIFFCWTDSNVRVKGYGNPRYGLEKTLRHVFTATTKIRFIFNNYTFLYLFIYMK